MTDERSEHTASTPEDLSSVEIIDDLRAELAANAATIASIAKHLDDAAKELRCLHILAIESVAEKAEAVCIGALTASVERENNAATIAAQAAEIERLKNRVHSENRSVFELNEKLHESRRIESAQAHGIELLREELAALRSQLEEQRKRLGGAWKFSFKSNRPYPDYVIVQPICGGWRCYRTQPSEDLIDPESNSMTFASLDKLFTQLDSANWLTPHAEKDGGE